MCVFVYCFTLTVNVRDLGTYSFSLLFHHCIHLLLWQTILTLYLITNGEEDIWVHILSLSLTWIGALLMRSWCSNMQCSMRGKPFSFMMRLRADSDMPAMFVRPIRASKFSMPEQSGWSSFRRGRTTLYAYQGRSEARINGGLCSVCVCVYQVEGLS